MKTRILIVMLCLSTTICFAQSTKRIPISLIEYIGLVVDSSAEIEISKELIKQNEYNLKAIKADYLPTLSASASAGYYLGNPLGSSVDITDYAFSTALKLEQTVYGGNLTRNKSKAAQIEYNIAELNHLATIQKEIYLAKVKYWEVVALNQQYLVVKEYVQIIRNLYEVIEQRFEDGYISRTDLLMVENRLNEAKLQERVIQKNRDVSIEEFNNMISNSDLPYYNASETFTTNISLPEFYPIQHALEHRADYLAVIKSVALASQNIRVTRSSFNPRLTAGVQGVYGTINPNTYNEQIGYGYAYLNFSANLFQFGKRINSVKQAKQTLIAEEINLKNARDNIESACRSSEIRLNESYKQRELALKNLNVSSESLELNTFSYTEGRISIVDVLSAQLSWIDNYNMAISSMQEYMVTLALYSYTFGL